MTFTIDFDLVLRLAATMDRVSGAASALAGDVLAGLNLTGRQSDAPARLDRLAGDQEVTARLLRAAVVAFEEGELDPSALAVVLGLDPSGLADGLALLAEAGISDPHDVLAVLLAMRPDDDLDLGLLPVRLVTLEAAGISDPDAIVDALIRLGPTEDNLGARDLLLGLPLEGTDPDLDASLDRLDAEVVPSLLTGEPVAIDSGADRNDLRFLVSVLFPAGAVPVPGTDTDGNVVLIEVTVGELTDEELVLAAAVGLGGNRAMRQFETDLIALDGAGLLDGQGGDSADSSSESGSYNPGTVSTGAGTVDANGAVSTGTTTSGIIIPASYPNPAGVAQGQGIDDPLADVEPSGLDDRALTDRLVAVRDQRDAARDEAVRDRIIERSAGSVGNFAGSVVGLAVTKHPLGGAYGGLAGEYLAVEVARLSGIDAAAADARADVLDRELVDLALEVARREGINIDLGTSNLIDGDGNFVDGDHNLLDGDRNGVVGNENEVHGDDNRIFGNNNRTVQGDGNVIDGNRNQLLGDDNSIDGDRNRILGDENVVDGDDNDVDGDGNSVLGDRNSVVGARNVVGGEDNRVYGNDNVTIGNNSAADGDGSTVLGDNSVAFGGGRHVEQDNVISTPFGDIDKTTGAFTPNSASPDPDSGSGGDDFDSDDGYSVGDDRDSGGDDDDSGSDDGGSYSGGDSNVGGSGGGGADSGADDSRSSDTGDDPSGGHDGAI